MTLHVTSSVLPLNANQLHVGFVVRVRELVFREGDGRFGAREGIINI